MRIVKSALLLSGIAVAALAVSPAFARALAPKAQPAAHTLTLRLPDGAVETVDYTGNTAPKVVLAPQSGAVEALILPEPVFDPAGTFSLAPTFATFERLSADMNREMDALWRDVTPAPIATAATSGAALSRLPAGATSYSMVSLWNGKNACSESTEILPGPHGGKDRVINREAGDCSAFGASGISTAPQPVRPVARPHYLQADYGTLPLPDPGLGPGWSAPPKARLPNILHAGTTGQPQNEATLPLPDPGLVPAPAGAHRQHTYAGRTLATPALLHEAYYAYGA